MMPIRLYALTTLFILGIAVGIGQLMRGLSSKSPRNLRRISLLLSVAALLASVSAGSALSHGHRILTVFAGISSVIFAAIWSVMIAALARHNTTM